MKQGLTIISVVALAGAGASSADASPTKTHKLTEKVARHYTEVFVDGIEAKDPEPGTGHAVGRCKPITPESMLCAYVINNIHDEWHEGHLKVTLYKGGTKVKVQEVGGYKLVKSTQPRKKPTTKPREEPRQAEPENINPGQGLPTWGGAAEEAQRACERKGGSAAECIE